MPLKDQSFTDEPLNELLARYASGSLSAPLQALVAGHIALDARSRAFVERLENACSYSLENQEPIALSSRDARLEAIFTQPQRSPEIAIRQSLQGDNVLPMPITTYLGMSFSDIRWRTLIPGVASEYKIEETERGEASLLWIRAGRKMPSHTHEGSEYTLVLKGSFSDKTGEYFRGDIGIADADIDHKPVAGSREDCICFAVTDAPLVLTNPVIKFFRKLLPH